MTYGVRVWKSGGFDLTPAEGEAVTRFLASFVAKKGQPPAGEWRVPGVGYAG